MNADGFVLADKPAGLGSASLVGRLRRELGGARVGHTGTLDRFASGLMLLVVGRATALADHFLHADKSYLADFVFGTATDTHDPTGTVQTSVPPSEAREFVRARRADIAAAIEALEGETRQQPPLFSALKKEGRRFSDRARAGEHELPAERSIRVYDLRILDWDFEAATVRVDLSVSGGTYIRAFARDLGRTLGFPVHLGGLRRHSLGGHSLAHPDLWVPDRNPARVLDLGAALPEWPRLSIGTDADRLRAIQQGRVVECAGPVSPAPEQDFFIEDGAGRILAWARAGAGGYRYKRVFL